MVLNGGLELQQLLFCDGLMHSRRVWASFEEWSKSDADFGQIWQISFKKGHELSGKLDEWFESDPARLWEGW
ncbi:hypothetical protein SAMN04515673_1043 [Poseidonocella sedimentorum]|uniref:Uncharacterized protein n=2 Tax=Poseidonocella sedimentorum TaxID=871652 RepID=A0A1I6DK43_9RHOB|nr:hypothetical protein SAMN04515673_1043 [Poseidonocella sedimentorum]